MIDFHTHILPNIDDGSRSIDETFNLIKEAKEAGFEGIVLTSHYIEKYYETNVPERDVWVNAISENLRNKGMDIDVYLGNEIYMSENIMQLLIDGKASTINNSCYVLFEMPLNVEPMNLYDVIYSLQEHKLIPILAHPERYTFVQKEPELITDLIEKATGGINIPTISVMGNAVDLNATVTQLMKLGIIGANVLGNIGTIVSGLSGRNNLSLYNWGAEDILKRGQGFTGITIGSTQTTSENGNTDMHADCSPHLSVEQPSLRPFDFSALRATGVIFNTYITAVDEKNFYLLDQHAAHERIFYEKLVGEYEQSEKSKQMLMLPLLIHVSLAAREDRFDWFDALNKMGFTMEEFGDGTYRVSEIPMFMELTEAEDFIRHFIDNIKDSTDLSNRVVIDKLITMSCKAAVKAHDALKPEEITALLHNLAKCRNPFSCPHGRPTFIKLTEYEIEKMFKRV